MTEREQAKIGGLLLAAGGSSRFGSPKQLFVYEGETLIRRAAETLLAAGCGHIVVVLGAEVERSRAELIGLDLCVVVNSEWGLGMSSSLRVGVDAVLEDAPDANGLLITLVDQPLVPASHLATLIEQFSRSRPRAVASRYSGVLGVPAVFSKELFPALRALGGDKGARDILRTDAGVIGIDAPSGAFDLDSPR